MSRPGPWSRWLDLLAHTEPAHPLALLRIATGLIVLREMLSPALHGVVPLLWLSEEHGGYRTFERTGSWLVNALGGPTPTLVWGLIALGTITGSALVVGIFARLSAAVALQCFLALAWINGHAGGSDDNLISNVLFLLVLAQSDVTGSVRARWQTGRFWPDTPAPAWPRYLVVGQVVAMYTSTGLHKASSAWVPGGDLSALYYILQQPTWQRFDLRAAAYVYPLTQAATFVTWCFEVFAPVLLLAMWWRHTAHRPGRLRAWSNRVDLRRAYLFIGVLMHAGIAATMDVGSFSWMAVATYVCAFHADELKRWVPGTTTPPSPEPPSPPETTAPPAAPQPPASADR